MQNCETINVQVAGNTAQKQAFLHAKTGNYMRHPRHSHFAKVCFLLLIVLTSSLVGKAQYNVYSFDNKYSNRFAHFGILMGFNRTEFRVKQSEPFLFSDSISSVQSSMGPGFNLGIVSNVHIGKNFDIRFLPSFSFTERALDYETFDDEDFTQRIESVNLEFPLLLKFKSNPYKDMRMYVVGGAKYTYDLASNAEARNADDIVKVGRHDFLLEYGFGFEIYFPYFILAPEIRVSQGIFDVHAPDPNLNLSRVLERLFTRSVSIVVNFEG